MGSQEARQQDEDDLDKEYGYGQCPVCVGEGGGSPIEWFDRVTKLFVIVYRRQCRKLPPVHRSFSGVVSAFGSNCIGSSQLERTSAVD